MEARTPRPSRRRGGRTALNAASPAPLIEPATRPDLPRAVPLILFVLVWLSVSWFGAWALNANNATRLFAAISMAEQRDATIDEFAALTVDQARFDGHVYSDKAPGMALMAVPAVLIADAATGETAAPIAKRADDPRLIDYLQLRLRLGAVFGAGLLTAIAAAMMVGMARDIAGSGVGGVIAALGYALGSPAWGWSTTLAGHDAVAALSMIAICAIWRGSRGASTRPAHGFLAGLAIGWAVVVEYQAVLAGVALGGWALWRMRGRGGAKATIAAAVTGGAIALAILIGYNMAAFGTPFRLGYQGVVGFQGMQQGLFGLTWPKPDVLVQILFGQRRGLMWVAPVLILAPIGLVRMLRMPGTRDLAILCIVVAAIVLLTNAAYVYWDGGHSTGPRHSIPAIPFLAVGLAGLWPTLERARARIGMVVLLMVSVGINLAIAATRIDMPENYNFPVWQPIFTEMVPAGAFRDLPSQFWGWSPWTGMALYLLIAGALGLALVKSARGVDRR